MSTTAETFDAKALCQISPFTVIWTATTSIKKPTKAGGLYEKKIVVIESATLSDPLSVEVTREQYERMRILYLQGIKTFSATEGVENTKGYRPLFISGAKIFHEDDKA